MNKGKYRGRQILSEESVEEMMKIQTANVPKNYVPKAAAGFTYALGSWVVEEKASVLPKASAILFYPYAGIVQIRYLWVSSQTPFYSHHPIGENRRNIQKTVP
jgi:hypothetical protein